jgi:hypothetical protein
MIFSIPGDISNGIRASIQCWIPPAQAFYLEKLLEIYIP